jgi:hypothetical protein
MPFESFHGAHRTPISDHHDLALAQVESDLKSSSLTEEDHADIEEVTTADKETMLDEKVAPEASKIRYSIMHVAMLADRTAVPGRASHTNELARENLKCLAIGISLQISSTKNKQT